MLGGSAASVLLATSSSTRAPSYFNAPLSIDKMRLPAALSLTSPLQAPNAAGSTVKELRSSVKSVRPLRAASAPQGTPESSNRLSASRSAASERRLLISLGMALSRFCRARAQVGPFASGQYIVERPPHSEGATQLKSPWPCWLIHEPEAVAHLAKVSAAHAVEPIKAAGPHLLKRQVPQCHHAHLCSVGAPLRQRSRCKWAATASHATGAAGAAAAAASCPVTRCRRCRRQGTRLAPRRTCLTRRAGWGERG